MKRLAAVLGWPISHSRSPAMHDAAFAACGLDAVMLPLAVRPERLGDAVRGLGAVDALGASVTVPHKHAVLAGCDVLAATAAAVGAANCLQFVDGQVVGHNTDAGGFVDGLRAAGVGAVARAVVLGGGGAARAVVDQGRHGGPGRQRGQRHRRGQRGVGVGRQRRRGAVDQQRRRRQQRRQVGPRRSRVELELHAVAPSQTG